MSLQVFIVPILTDNYAYVLVDPIKNVSAIVDPGEAKPIQDFLSLNNITPNFVLNTHYHSDHIQGNAAFKSSTIIGPEKEKNKIPFINISVKENDTVSIGTKKAKIFEVPGHTLGHIAFWFEEDSILFSGDTLFSIGCGRLFEGTYEQMYQSLKKLSSLPNNTKVYCGHEYTLSNLKFALSIEPNNLGLLQKLKEVKLLRENSKPSIPSTIGEEKLLNPFLRTEDIYIQQHINIKDQNPLLTFKRLRLLKDNFR